jgi:cyclohexanone monooxygenase
MRQRVRATYAERRNLSRMTRFGIPAAMPSDSALDATPEERQAKYQNAWINSQLLGFRQCYGDILSNIVANDTVADFIRDKIVEIVEDKATAKKLSPHGFPFGTKRPCLGDTYYSVFNRKDVNLVDLKVNPIQSIVPEGILTAEGLFELDMLIYATGYDALTGALTKIDIQGLSGQKLTDKWSNGARAYLGLVVSDFPNMFTVTGPGSPGPLANMSMSIEQHINWITACIEYLHGNSLARIDANKEHEERWMSHVQEVVQKTLYEKANSWYRGANVPGKPQIFVPYLGGFGNYKQKCEDVARAGYEGFILT